MFAVMRKPTHKYLLLLIGHFNSCLSKIPRSNRMNSKQKSLFMVKDREIRKSKWKYKKLIIDLANHNCWECCDRLKNKGWTPSFPVWTKLWKYLLVWVFVCICWPVRINHYWVWSVSVSKEQKSHKSLIDSYNRWRSGRSNSLLSAKRK